MRASIKKLIEKSLYLIVLDHPAKKSGCAFPNSSVAPADPSGKPPASVSPVKTLPYISPMLPPLVAPTVKLPSVEVLYTNLSSPSINSSILFSFLE